MTTRKKIFLIAGESSGDLHGALLVKELRRLNADLDFYGLGGQAMQGAGVHIFYDLPSVAALGLADVLKNYFVFLGIFRMALRKVEELKPDLIILIDYPGFNIRFAKKIRRRFPILYYISPQVWAWGKRRIGTIARSVQKMLVLFPFEVETYQGSGLDVEFVGHPLVDLVKPTKPVDEIRREWGLDQKKILAVLPGSRRHEVKRILPILLRSAEFIMKEIPNSHFVLTESPSLPEKLYSDILKDFRLPLTRIRNRTHDALALCDFALVASGTATLEATLSLKPFLIVYKIAPTTYLLGKQLVRIPFLGMVNILAGKRVIAEFIQEKAQPEKIAYEAVFVLSHEDTRERIVEELASVKKKLGEEGACERAARAVLRFLEKKGDRLLFPQKSR